MSFTGKTPSGSWRASWRDPSGKQKSKDFKTKKEAIAFLAEIDAASIRGTYVDPRAGKAKFGPYAGTWLAARNTEKTSTARDASFMRTHVLPKWEGYPINSVTHSLMQAWVTELSGTLAPATVAKGFHLVSAVFASAIRDRMITVNPCEGVKLPSIRRGDDFGQIITREELTRDLLPTLSSRFRALVALAGGTGLRWGEANGLCLDAVDFHQATASVIRTAIEVSGAVSLKPYPKTRAGRRTVPLPRFVLDALKEHTDVFPCGEHGEIFISESGGPLYRGTFRHYVWRPALVRAGLLGSIEKQDDGSFLASWSDGEGLTHSETVVTEESAVVLVAKKAAGGLRFHDLRHSYATWLVSAGVPINEVARVLGHGQISTTLNRYTHVLPNPEDRIRRAFED